MEDWGRGERAGRETEAVRAEGCEDLCIHGLHECPTGPLPNMAMPAVPARAPHSAHGPDILFFRVKWQSYKYYEKKECQAEGERNKEFI